MLPLLFTLAAGGGTPRAINADALVDLRRSETAALVSAQWRYRDAHIVETDFRAAGADRKPSGAPLKTHDVHPRVGTADFEQDWQTISADSLEERRSTGKLALGWYRLSVELPEKLGAFEVEHSTLVLELVVDDYAEVWVDGSLPQVLGSTGAPFVAGWNAPSRVVLTRDAHAGRRFDVAVLAANAPLSAPPENYVWIRSATLDLYAPGKLATSTPVAFEIERTSPALDELVPPGTRLEQLADGFQFTEGPAWSPDGALLFSDPNANTIYRWTELGGVQVYRPKSGYTGVDIGRQRQPGSNGLAFDREGRLTICEHGNRRVTRLEKNGTLTVLADRYRGQRLNSPNDLVYRSDGALYFSDPPFGLPQFHDDPARELDVTGVFCLIGGELKLVSTDLRGPNGLGFSPDEKTLYVANWDEQKKVVMSYDVASDGTLANGRVFFDMTNAPGDEALDGLEVDARGNLYVSGPGGLWVLSPKAERLGLLKLPELAANMEWGDADRRTLYLTARTGLYRMRLGVPGL